MSGAVTCQPCKHAENASGISAGKSAALLAAALRAAGREWRAAGG